MRDLYNQLIQHAQKNYESSGWDTIVECLDYSDFMREVKEYSLPAEWNAILSHFESGCKAYDEYRKDIQATAF